MGLLQDRKIRGLLEGCSLEHDARMEAFNGRVRDRVLSDARWKKLQVQQNKAVCFIVFWFFFVISPFFGTVVITRNLSLEI